VADAVLGAAMDGGRSRGRLVQQSRASAGGFRESRLGLGEGACLMAAAWLLSASSCDWASSVVISWAARSFRARASSLAAENVRAIRSLTSSCTGLLAGGCWAAASSARSRSASSSARDSRSSRSAT
jgi:hypothetical protein